MRGRRLRVAAAVLLAGSAMHCASCNDADGTPDGARDLALGDQQDDSLGGRDRADWYRLEVDAKGVLAIWVSPHTRAGKPAAYKITLLGPDRMRVGSIDGGAGRAVTLERVVPPGSYYAGVSVRTGAMKYEIKATAGGRSY